MSDMTHLSIHLKVLLFTYQNIEEKANHDKGMLKCSSCIRWFLPVIVTFKPFHVCKVAAMPSELFLLSVKKRAFFMKLDITLKYIESTVTIIHILHRDQIDDRY